MASYSLFVYEGERAEKNIHNSMYRNVLCDLENTAVICAYCTHVYKFGADLSKDEDLDAFVLLKNMPKNTQLKNIRRSEISEIYLFFDYDGHVPGASNKKLQDLIGIFSDETDKGKIYISYPMVEALKHASVKSCFSLETAVSEKSYKGKAKAICSGECEVYNDFLSLNKERWLNLIEQHLMKANYIVFDDFSMLDSLISQDEILINQIEKYIKPDNVVAVLSAFPMFLVDYYGVEGLNFRLENLRSESG